MLCRRDVERLLARLRWCRPKYEYMWADGQAIKRPMAVSAPRYVDYLMTWVQNQLDDENLFPTQMGKSTPSRAPASTALHRITHPPGRASAHALTLAPLHQLAVTQPIVNLRHVPLLPVPGVRTVPPTNPSRAVHRAGVPFPPDFTERVQNIFKRLFRVYAHIYYCHFERMQALGAEPHLNTCFKHYMYFVREFNLIPKAEETAPLKELIDKLLEGSGSKEKAAGSHSAE